MVDASCLANNCIRPVREQPPPLPQGRSMHRLYTAPSATCTFQEPVHPKDSKNPGAMLFAGGCSGLVTGVLVLPLSRLTILQQTGVLVQLNLRYLQQGAALWSGCGVACMRSVVKKSVLFQSNDLYKNILKVQDGYKAYSQYSFLGPFTSGGLAAATATITTYSLELPYTIKAGRGACAHVGEGKYGPLVAKIVHQSGLQGLFRGMSPSLLHSALKGGIKFSIYNFGVDCQAIVSPGTALLARMGIQQWLQERGCPPFHICPCSQVECRHLGQAPDLPPRHCAEAGAAVGGGRSPHQLGVCHCDVAAGGGAHLLQRNTSCGTAGGAQGSTGVLGVRECLGALTGPQHSSRPTKRLQKQLQTVEDLCADDHQLCSRIHY